MQQHLPSDHSVNTLCLLFLSMKSTDTASKRLPFLSLACTPTLSGSSLSLPTSHFLICYSYTHTESSAILLQTTGGKESTSPEGHRSEEYTETHSTTTRNGSGEQDPVPRKAEKGAFVLTAKWIQVQAQFLQGPPGKENSCRNWSPCPFSMHLRTHSPSQGYPEGRQDAQRELSLSQHFQQPFCKASKWSSNWHLTSKRNLISPVKHAGTLFGSNGRGKKWPVKSWRLLLLVLLLFTKLKTTSHTHTHTPCLLYWSWARIAQ